MDWYPPWPVALMAWAWAWAWAWGVISHSPSPCSSTVQYGSVLYHRRIDNGSHLCLMYGYRYDRWWGKTTSTTCHHDVEFWREDICGDRKDRHPTHPSSQTDFPCERETRQSFLSRFLRTLPSTCLLLQTTIHLIKWQVDGVHWGCCQSLCKLVRKILIGYCQVRFKMKPFLSCWVVEM